MNLMSGSTDRKQRKAERRQRQQDREQQDEKEEKNGLLQKLFRKIKGD